MTKMGNKTSATVAKGKSTISKLGRPQSAPSDGSTSIGALPSRRADAASSPRSEDTANVATGPWPSPTVRDSTKQVGEASTGPLKLMESPRDLTALRAGANN
ncbi:uncharacterized protein G2W53_003882 [Senna tora]|uniref:Uncharacterized protein n=1 Tax=Senna tora TaxID=362788 RepID=A0A834XAX5_9FABA|nr:uncharacterized protein G2W53_003882 [Senna tora]